MGVRFSAGADRWPTVSADLILERAVHVAAGGLKNPLQVLVEVAKHVNGGETRAWTAAQAAAGMPLSLWYGIDGAGRTVEDTVRLFQDALFEVQLAG